MVDYLSSAECVSKFHADKICDYCADSILDAYIAQEKNSRADIDILFNGDDSFWISAQIYTTATVSVSMELETLYALKKIGFTIPENLNVSSSIAPESDDISIGVTKGRGLFHNEQGAGDSGICIGAACDDVPSILMPMPIFYARRIIEELEKARNTGKYPFLRGDAKALVTVQYKNGKPVSVYSAIVSIRHDPRHYYDINDAAVEIINSVIPEKMRTKIQYYVNCTGRWCESGDSGQSGHKILMDTYGGYFGHGDSFSGKSGGKLDRGGNYFARYMAKNIVASGAASMCEVRLTYAIGLGHAISISVETFGTSKYDNKIIAQAIHEIYGLCSPEQINEKLELCRPIYSSITNHHFGVSADDTELYNKIYSWERTDKTEELLDVVKTLSKLGKK